MPAGISRGRPSTSRTAPKGARANDTASSRCPAYCSDATPAATASAGSVRLRTAPAPGAAPRPCSRGSIRATAGSTSGGTARNTQRQDSSSATTPATDGPTIAGITQALAITENSRGRSESG